jgi:hypothetical protein
MASILVQKFKRKIINLPADAAFLLSQKFGRSDDMSPDVRPVYIDLGPEEIARIARDLRQNGFARSSLQEIGLSSDHAVLASADVVADRLHAQAAQLSLPISSSTLTSSPADIIKYPEIYRFGLHKAFLEIAGSYFGSSVAYDGCMVFFSIPDGKENGARYWHKDREDRNVLKMGLYLTDVLPESGPLEVAVSRNPAMERSVRAYSNAALFNRFPDIDSVRLTGRRGTIVFADTARYYHRGSPPTASYRSMVYFTYMRSPPAFPFYCSRTQLSSAQIDDLVFGLDAQQVEAAHWRSRVTSWKRWVPQTI